MTDAVCANNTPDDEYGEYSQGYYAKLWCILKTTIEFGFTLEGQIADNKHHYA